MKINARVTVELFHEGEKKPVRSESVTYTGLRVDKAVNILKKKTAPLKGSAA